jgi:hypothetical protein
VDPEAAAKAAAGQGRNMNPRSLERWILAATILASGMAFLMSSAVGIALPSIQSYFEASLGQIQ